MDQILNFILSLTCAFCCIVFWAGAIVCKIGHVHLVRHLASSPSCLICDCENSYILFCPMCFCLLVLEVIAALAGTAARYQKSPGEAIKFIWFELVSRCQHWGITPTSVTRLPIRHRYGVNKKIYIHIYIYLFIFSTLFTSRKGGQRKPGQDKTSKPTNKQKRWTRGHCTISESWHICIF